MFEQLGRYQMKQAPAEFVLDMIDGKPVLLVTPATESNPKYFNEYFKKNKARLTRMRRRGIDFAQIKEDRETDRQLYPGNVIKGWRGVLDADGNEVQYTDEVCLEFLAALPDWIFDEIRAFAGNPASFVDEAMAGN